MKKEIFKEAKCLWSPRSGSLGNLQHLEQWSRAGADCTGCGSRNSTAPSKHCCPDLQTQLGNEFTGTEAVLS